MKKPILFIVALLVLAACSDSNSFENVPFLNKESGSSYATEDSKDMDESEPVPTKEDDDTRSLSTEQSIDIPEQKMVVQRKLIWAADLEFQVKNVDEATKNILKMVEKYDGFISDMQLTNNSYQISNQITIRVSNKQFHTLVNATKGESIFIDRANISSNDVSEEFVDLESRLQTKREVRDRYIKILRDKTGTIQDVIQAEEAIRTITEEIEAKEGRLRFLTDRVDNSTIVMNIYEKVAYVDQPNRYEKGYGEEMGDSFSKGWSAITSVLLAVVTLWPLILLLGLLYWRRKWIIKLFSGKLGD